MVDKKALALVLLVVASLALQAQSPDIAISTGTQISTDNANNPHAESFLAINPKDPKNWLATSNVIERGRKYAYPYVTRDGGKTWRRGHLKGGNNAIFEGGDPIIYFDAEGVAFFGTIGVPLGWLLSRSTDNGSTWEDPVTVPGGSYDRPYVAFDTTGGKFNGRMYAGGKVGGAELNGKHHSIINIVYSDDHGRTFSGGNLLFANPADGQIFVISDMLVSSDGKLIVPFATGDSVGHLWTAVSEDGGLSFLPAGRGPSHTRGPGFRASQSGSAPRAAIDASPSPYRDRIYLTWADFDGMKYVIKVSYSSDMGKTWSTPVVVNDNTNDGVPANPAVAVNKDGAVAILFNDRRDDPKNSCYRLYVAVSLDGGESFTPNVRASERATCPLAEGNWGLSAMSVLDPSPDLSTERRRRVIAMTNIPSRWSNGGDTQGLAADSDGVFHAAWINGETGVMQLWSKDFTVDKKAALQSALADSRKDLSRGISLEASDPVIDFQKHSLSVKVRLENALQVAVDGPFILVLDDIRSSLKDLHVVNADNEMYKKGASWNFTTGQARSLAPKQKSDERELHFEFTGGPPDDPRGPFLAYFKILGPATVQQARQGASVQPPRRLLKKSANAAFAHRVLSLSY